MNTTSENTHPPAPAKRISPMRLIRQLLFVLRGRGEDSLELTVIDRAITREEAGIQQALGESRAIETTWERVRRMAHEFLHDDRTPGVIDATESRKLSRVMLSASLEAHTHTQTLEALS